ncbi:sulfate ABC transporter permease subunit [Brevibacillus fulvus]|uniref:Sulfate transport system permease protein n=1 Tax=Brevibacillus fulvus TaxID=1125967 RepID=A0A938XW28_9BACL|nr:sulfate ABC transporter permease subunit [Brevibacillus fulvus]MBM7589001.1 sulfate transport system permease protein [Brevibacillus fulvus]
MRSLFILLTVLLFVLILVLPFLGILAGAGAEGFAAIYEALMRPESLHALQVSFIIVLIVTLCNGVLGILFSLQMVRGPWLAGWLRPLLNAIVDLPFAVSPVIGGLMIILLFGPNTLLGAFFENVGFKIVFALPGMVMATIFVTFPLMIRELVPVLTELGQTAEEASATLGAGPIRTFFRVTWPSIRWAVYYGLALTAARAIGEFGAVLVVSGNIVKQTQTATTLVYQDSIDQNLVAANSVALLLGLISIVILLFLEWMKKRKEDQLHAH